MRRRFKKPSMHAPPKLSVGSKIKRAPVLKANNVSFRFFHSILFKIDYNIKFFDRVNSRNEKTKRKDCV